MSRIDRAGLISKLTAIADAEDYKGLLVTRAEAKSLIQAPEVLRCYVRVANDAYTVDEAGQRTEKYFPSVITGSISVAKSDMRAFIERSMSDMLEGRGARLRVTASRYRSHYQPKHDGRLIVWIG